MNMIRLETINGNYDVGIRDFKYEEGMLKGYLFEKGKNVNTDISNTICFTSIDYFVSKEKLEEYKIIEKDDIHNGIIYLYQCFIYGESNFIVFPYLIPHTEVFSNYYLDAGNKVIPDENGLFSYLCDEKGIIIYRQNTYIAVKSLLFNSNTLSFDNKLLEVFHNQDLKYEIEVSEFFWINNKYYIIPSKHVISYSDIPYPESPI